MEIRREKRDLAVPPDLRVSSGPRLVKYCWEASPLRPEFSAMRAEPPRQTRHHACTAGRRSQYPRRTEYVPNVSGTKADFECRTNGDVKAGFHHISYNPRYECNFRSAVQSGSHYRYRQWGTVRAPDQQQGSPPSCITEPCGPFMLVNKSLVNTHGSC